MSKEYGYEFYIDGVLLPITPGELTIKSNSRNDTVDLINEGEINILKSPSLIEVEFEARFPMRKYPYSRDPQDFLTYFDKFKELKEKKKPFRFIVTRTTPGGKLLWDTNLLMALEDFSTNESADEGDDVIVSIDLKQYKEYAPVLIDLNNTTSTGNNKRDNSNAPSAAFSEYTVQSGDCLWNIAKAAYGDGSKWPVIYEANKDIIEKTANKYRSGKGSSNGHWIYPGTKLTIPDANGADLTVQKLKNKSNTKSVPTKRSAMTANDELIATESITPKAKKRVPVKGTRTIIVNNQDITVVDLPEEKRPWW